MPSNESTEAARLIQALGDAIEKQVDLDKLLALSRTDETLKQPKASHVTSPQPKVRIGVAHDRAFGFYYADDFDAMRADGAEVIPFDATRDQQLPEVDALFIGGGFPEMLAAELSANTGMRKAIANAIQSGMPVYAECGGLMYLSRSITYQGKTHEMVGAIPGDIVMHEKPVGRGYVTLAENDNHPWQAYDSSEKTIRAHEFHYSSLDNLPANTRFAFRVVRGHGIDGKHDGLVLHNTLACYTHQRSVGNCHWATRFVEFVRKHKQQAATPLAVNI
jgi:cobyrinic acid a,c-diamide synthase